MDDNKPKLLTENSELENQEQAPKPGFFQRAFNRTKEAIKNVDEAITNRETFRRIEDRLQNHEEIQELLASDFSAKMEKAEKELLNLGDRLDKEVEKLVATSTEQRITFERTLAEVTATVTTIHNTAIELRTTANTAQEALTTASQQQQEMQKQASGHLARWNNESENLKTDVRNLQSQMQQLQQSFQQFFITAIIGFVILTALIGYLLFKD